MKEKASAGKNACMFTRDMWRTSRVDAFTGSSKVSVMIMDSKSMSKVKISGDVASRTKVVTIFRASSISLPAMSSMDPTGRAM